MQFSGVDTEVWREHAWLNRLQSVFLLAVLGGLLALLGWLLWGTEGVLMLLALGALFVFLSPSLTPRLIMHLYGARALSPAEAPALYATVRELADRSGLTTTPVLYYVRSGIVNAFAVGHRDASALALTDGMLRVLDWREQVGVLAHEISHIRGNDMWVMGLADMFSRLTSLLSLFGQLMLLISLPLMLMSNVPINWLAILVLVFAPTLSALAQLGLSRTREYHADLNAARLTGDPEGLARALLKIEQVQGAWLERLLLPGRSIPEPSLLRTHPPTQERIRRLMALKGPIEAACSAMPGAPCRPKLPGREAIRRRPHWRISGLWY